MICCFEDQLKLKLHNMQPVNGLQAYAASSIRYT